MRPPRKRQTKLVFGAHAAGKTTYLKQVSPGTAIGNRSFDASSPKAWEPFKKPGFYEVAPMLPGAVTVLDPRNEKLANVRDVVDFSKLSLPPRTFEFIHVCPHFEAHLPRYIERDARRFGMSDTQAANALKRSRAYYALLDAVLQRMGCTVHRMS